MASRENEDLKPPVIQFPIRLGHKDYFGYVYGLYDAADQSVIGCDDAFWIGSETARRIVASVNMLADWPLDELEAWPAVGPTLKQMIERIYRETVVGAPAPDDSSKGEKDG